MNRILTMTLAIAAAAATSACNRAPGTATPPAFELSRNVEVVELEPAANGARVFDLHILGDERYTFTDHAVALMMAMGEEHCAGNGFALGGDRDNFTTGDARPEADQQLTMQVTCALGLLPNHRTVEAGTKVGEVFESPAGSQTRRAYMESTDVTDTPSQVANRLIGGFVREAYTEECGQRPMVIERIDTATESGPKARMHGQLAFRCLDPEAASDG